MRSLILIITILMISFSGHAHQGEDNQASCHEHSDGVLHCHVNED